MSRPVKIYPMNSVEEQIKDLEKITYHFTNRGYRVLRYNKHIEVYSKFSIMAEFSFECDDAIGDTLSLSFKTLRKDNRFYTNEDIDFINETYSYFINFGA